MSLIHSEQTLADGIHIIQAFSYANAAARVAAAGFTNADVGKVAIQTDDNSFWLCVSQAAGTPSWSLLTTATRIDSCGGQVRWGTTSTIGNSTADRFWTAYGTAGPLTVNTDIRARIFCTRSGVARGAVGAINAAVAADIVLTVQKNNVDQTITVSIPNGSTSGTNSANSFTFAIGDTLTLKCVASAAIATNVFPVFDLNLGPIA